MADILEAASQPTPISHILAKAYLNYKRGKRYIDRLLQLGLLEKRNEKYVATERGEEFLLYYHRLKVLLEEKRAPPEKGAEEAPSGEKPAESG